MRNQSGFALLQIVIAAAIFAVLASAISSLLVQQKSAIVRLEDQLLKVQLMSSVESLLSNTESCRQSLLGLSILPVGRVTPLSQIKDHRGNTVYQSESTIDFLEIGQIQILNETIDAPNSSGFISIEVPLKSLRGWQGASDLKPYKKDQILVSVGGAGEIIDCSSGSGIEDEGSFEAFAPNGVDSADEDIPGTHSLCVFSGYTTTANDSDMYDSCRVLMVGPGTWRIQLRKHAEDSLRCYAQCYNIK
jgi:type II secretory pathway pseudopilin PulG